MLVTRKLYPNIAGMATHRAVTVVISAPDTPGAIETRLGYPASATPVKASMTPQTVPSNPRNGEPLTAVASKIICDSSESAVSPTARSIAALTAPICAAEILLGSPEVDDTFRARLE